MDKKTFVIIHGSYGSAQGNWFPWLKEKLEAHGHTVIVPQFPTPQGQSLDNWLKKFHEVVPEPDENFILIGHSLGATFVVRLLEKLKKPVLAAVLVAPFMGPIGIMEYDVVNRTFFDGEIDWEKLRRNTRHTLAYGSNNDPAVPQEMEEEVAKNMRTRLTIIRGGKHLNADAGFTSFPRLLNDIEKQLLTPNFKTTPENKTRMFIERTLKSAGGLVMQTYGQPLEAQVKKYPSNIVTEVDLKSERFIVDQIQKTYRYDSIVAEESGFYEKQGDYCWTVDPLDGTANYAAGMPWFGIMISQMYKWDVIAAGIYLPALHRMYYAEKGKGVTCNGKPLQVSTETDIKKVLVLHAMDYRASFAQSLRHSQTSRRLALNTRNIRIVHCTAAETGLVATGKMGAMLHPAISKIWDVAPASLILQEAGAKCTESNGQPFDFKTDKTNYSRVFTYLMANPILHTKLKELI